MDVETKELSERVNRLQWQVSVMRYIITLGIASAIVILVSGQDTPKDMLPQTIQDSITARTIYIVDANNRQRIALTTEGLEGNSCAVIKVMGAKKNAGISLLARDSSANLLVNYGRLTDQTDMNNRLVLQASAIGSQLRIYGNTNGTNANGDIPAIGLASLIADGGSPNKNLITISDGETNRLGLICSGEISSLGVSDQKGTLRAILGRTKPTREKEMPHAKESSLLLHDESGKLIWRAP